MRSDDDQSCDRWEDRQQKHWMNIYVNDDDQSLILELLNTINYVVDSGSGRGGDGGLKR